jgi:hypothetical protein
MQRTCEIGTRRERGRLITFSEQKTVSSLSQLLSGKFSDLENQESELYIMKVET